ncbi:MAG: hypothetical protein QGG40_12575, partial [Myxococcota bacterium]|nr:hypothetical protein [Myxococcota bacterium]
DPRFARCTAETMAQLLWRRDTGVDDYAKIEDLRQAFELSGLNPKTLITAILETPTYRAGGVAQDAPDSVVDREITARLLSPDQLDSAVEDLTGFQWRVPQGTFQQLANDTYGYRVMAGGIDGTTVLEHQVDATLTWALVVKRLAQGAAYYVVENDIHQEASEPTLLAGVDMQSVPGEEAFTALLEDLFWRFHAVRPSADDLAGIEALWTEVDANNDAYEAWRVVVWVLLNDPLFVTY